MAKRRLVDGSTWLKIRNHNCDRGGLKSRLRPRSAFQAAQHQTPSRFLPHPSALTPRKKSELGCGLSCGEGQPNHDSSTVAKSRSNPSRAFASIGFLGPRVQKTRKIFTIWEAARTAPLSSPTKREVERKKAKGKRNNIFTLGLWTLDF